MIIRNVLSTSLCCVDKVSTLVSCKLNKFTLSYFSFRIHWKNRCWSVCHTPIHNANIATRIKNHKLYSTNSCSQHTTSMSTTHRKPIIQLSTCSCLGLFMSFVLFVRNFHRYVRNNRIRTLTHVCSNLTKTLNIKLSLEEYESPSNQASAAHYKLTNYTHTCDVEHTTEFSYNNKHGNGVPTSNGCEAF